MQPIFEDLKAELGTLDASYVVRLAPSVGVGLLEYSAQVGASILILGSARTGASGRYAVGSVAGLLQHASPVPLAFAPQGFAQVGAESVERVVCGYSTSPDSPRALEAAIELCRTHGAPLQLVTFVFPDYPLIRHLPGLGSASFEAGAQSEAARRDLDDVAATVPDDIAVQTFVRTGGNIAQAVARAEWHDGDLLVLGSAPMGPFARVFLGSTALKLVKSCPVPVIAVPRAPKPKKTSKTAKSQAAPTRNDHADPSRSRPRPRKTESDTVSEQKAPPAPSGGVIDKGLAPGKVSTLSGAILGVSSVAPGYTLTASIGLIVAAVGFKMPAIFIAGFIPMFLTAYAYRELNSDSPDCGASFT